MQTAKWYQALSRCYKWCELTVINLSQLPSLLANDQKATNVMYCVQYAMPKRY
jgi:hypothetical protein